MKSHLELMKALLPEVRAAGEAILACYQKVEASKKADGSPVTAADQAAEKILLAALANIEPSLPVISEEKAESHEYHPEQRFFLVDPLDGTREFLKADGEGAFTVNVALIDQGLPVFGIVFAPLLDRLFWGSASEGAFELHGEQALRLEVQADRPKAPTALVSASHLCPATKDWLKRENIDWIRPLGSSLKFCLLAAGEGDLYPRFGPTMEWDTAAGDAILRAAGGATITEADKALDYGKPGYRNDAFIARAWSSSPLFPEPSA